MSAVERRSGSGLYADGRSSGGSGPVGVAGRRRGEAGSSVVDKGDGADGGGRWINVSLSPSSAVTTALGLLRSGSGKRAGGRSGRRVAYVLHKARSMFGKKQGAAPLYHNTNETNKNE